MERNKRRLNDRNFSDETTSTTNKSSSLKSNRTGQIKSCGKGKKSRITKILLAISISFVLLRLPYFIAWCRFSTYKVFHSQPLNKERSNELRQRNEIVDFTVILNLFDYALTGLLYFATGKSYQKNLHAFFCCFCKIFSKICRCK